MTRFITTLTVDETIPIRPRFSTLCIFLTTSQTLMVPKDSTLGVLLFSSVEKRVRKKTEKIRKSLIFVIFFDRLSKRRVKIIFT